MNPPEAKAHLRHNVSERLGRLSMDDRLAASSRLCDRLDDATAQVDGIIMAFLPLPDEIDLEPFLRRRLVGGLAVPIVDWTSGVMHPGRLHGLGPDHLRADRHGLRTPVQDSPVGLEEIGIVLVPGLAFDRSCRRLGRGGGFYDRLLANDTRPALAIGVGFDEQLVDVVPVEPWDRQVDRVLTPSEDFTVSR